MSNEKQQQEPGDIFDHGQGDPPDEKNFVCSDCGEEYPMSELWEGNDAVCADPTTPLCKGCEPCPCCGSPVVDGKCEDLGDHGCRGPFPDCETPFDEKEFQ